MLRDLPLVPPCAARSADSVVRGSLIIFILTSGKGAIPVPRRVTGVRRRYIKFHWVQLTVSSALSAAAKIRLLRH